MFIAKLIGPDGFVDRKEFAAFEAARDWLTGAGLQAFEGDVEKAELWSDGELLRFWPHPKTESQREAAWRSDDARAAEAKRQRDREIREWRKRRRDFGWY